jgi:hypothetical protein
MGRFRTRDLGYEKVLRWVLEWIGLRTKLLVAWLSSYLVWLLRQRRTVSKLKLADSNALRNWLHEEKYRE